MILSHGAVTEDLMKYHSGEVDQGLGIGIPDLDRHIRYKQGQFNIILGHDNVGKTNWFVWYALCLSSHYGITWTFWLGENKPVQVVRDLIQMYTGKRFKDLTEDQVRSNQMIIEGWFSFVDNTKLYTPTDLLSLFDKSTSQAFFIDPFTGLDRQFTHEANYQFLNAVRHFTNSTKKTLYMSTHPNSESGRAGRLYPKGDPWEGHLMPPLKDHVEGGKPFTNRVDDFIIVHRLVKATDEMKFKTIIDVAKVKDTESGGKVTGYNNPILCDWNSGLGFQVGFDQGINRTPISDKPLSIFEQARLNNDLPF